MNVFYLIVIEKKKRIDKDSTSTYPESSFPEHRDASCGGWTHAL